MHGRLRAQPGAVVARRRPAGLQRQAARARLAAVRGDHGRRGPARARRSPTPASRGSSTGPRASRRTTSSSSARARSAGSSSPPGSARTGSPAPAGSAGRWRAGSSTASRSSTCGRWTSGGSAASTGGRASGRSPGRPRSTRPTTTSTTRTRSARPAGRCGPRRPTSDSRRSARSSARSAAGSGPTGSSRTPTIRAAAAVPRSRPSGRAAGRASTGRPAIGAEALATRQAGRAVRRDVLRQDRGHRAAARRRSSSGSARTTSTSPVGRDRLHLDAQPARRHRGRPHRDPRSRRTASCSSPARRSATTTWAGSGSTCPPTARSRLQRRHVGAASASGCGARAPATLLAPLTTDDLSNAAFPFLTARAITIGPCPGLRAAGDVRRRARLGAVRATRSTAARSGTTLWEAGRRARPRRRRLPGDRRPPAREGLPRLVERHHARRDPVRGRPRVRGRASTRDATSSAARRSSRRRPPAPEAAALPRPRRPALGLPRQRAGPGRRRDRRPGDVRRLRLRRRAVDRLRLPAAGRARSGRAARSTSSASGSASRSSREPLYDPASERICGRERRGRGPVRRFGAGRAPVSPARPRRSSRRGSRLAHAACDEADAIARLGVPARPRDLDEARPDVRHPGRHRDRAGDPGPDRAPPTRTTASSARSTAPRPATPRPAGTSTRSTAPTTSSAGVPLFGTLLAVERDGELQAAVISAPALRERWWARRGGGAWARGADE